MTTTTILLTDAHTKTGHQISIDEVEGDHSDLRCGVWIDTEIADPVHGHHDGLVLGTGPSRGAALADAVDALKTITGQLESLEV